MTTFRRQMEADAVRRGLDWRAARAMGLRDLSMWLYEALRGTESEQSINLGGLAEGPPRKRGNG